MFTRIVYSIVIAALCVTVFATNAFAQDGGSYKNDRGETVAAVIYPIEPKFKLKCPVYEVLDVSHPCAEVNRQALQRQVADKFVLVCPIKEVLDRAHPCAEVNRSAFNHGPDDLVLACPIYEVLDPAHPCSEVQATQLHRHIDDFVLACPSYEVLNPEHPCSDANGRRTDSVRELVIGRPDGG